VATRAFLLTHYPLSTLSLTSLLPKTHSHSLVYFFSCLVYFRLFKRVHTSFFFLLAPSFSRHIFSIIIINIVCQVVLREKLFPRVQCCESTNDIKQKEIHRKTNSIRHIFLLTLSITVGILSNARINLRINFPSNLLFRVFI
jgi:hypothetical protein